MLTERFVLLCWAILCGYWAWSSLSAKASVRKRTWQRWYLPARFIVPASAIGYVALASGHFPLQHAIDTATGVLGALVCALGIGIAIWARHYIGENWGMPMTQREEPELVTSGPYAWIRHPIYGGLLVALLGTLLTINPKALVGWPIAFAYFTVSAIKEERDLQEVFPTRYREYMQHTKRLVPFVW